MDASGGLWVTLLMALTSDPSDPEHSVEKSALEAANYYIRIGKPEYAIKIVATLVDTKNRLEFYRSVGLIDGTIEYLLETRKIDELYRVLKGNNRFEEGANIALKFNDIENHIGFVVLDIKAKLWTHDASYTEIEKQDDIQKLQLLEQQLQTHKYYTKEQINYCIAMLKNSRKDYNNILLTSYGFMRLITFDAFLNAFKPKNNVIPILKNLGFLLRLHKLHQEELKYVDVRMKIFYHIKVFFRDGEYKCSFPPIMLLKLHVNTYEIDIDGNVTMPFKELKVLLDRHIRSIAKSWLKVLDELLGKIKQPKNGLKRCVRVKNMIGTLRYCTNLISCKYYYEQFGVSYAEELDYDVTGTMLLNVLSLPWICYIPNDHTSVQVFLQVPVIEDLFKQLQFPESWAFQGNTKKQFHNFKKFAKETIDRYSSSVPADENLASFISEFEIITIGLLAAFSKINKDHSVIVPQSYEIVTQWFNEINNRRFFSLIRKPPIKYEEAIDLSLKIIKILLGNDPFINIFVRTCIMKYPDHYPLQYQFERCLVLSLTLFGNLAPILEDDIRYLFQIRLQTIDKLSTTTQAQNTSHPKVFRCLISEAANAVATNELFVVMYKIQKLYCRKMAKLDLQMKMKPYEVVEPVDFPCSLLYPADSTTTQNSKETHNA